MFLSIKRFFHLLVKHEVMCAHRTPIVEGGPELENALKQLSMWGRPKLFLTTSGWYCFVDIGQNQHGTFLSVGSDLHHDLPREAAIQCLKRAKTHHPAAFKSVKHTIPAFED